MGAAIAHNRPNLAYFNRDLKEFLRRFMTMD